MTSPEQASRFVAYLCCGPGEADLAPQRGAIARHAAANGLIAAGEFRDLVAADDDLSARPALFDVLLAVARGDVALLLVESAERLSPDPVRREIVLRQLQRARVTVVAAGSGEDLTAPGGDATTALIRRVLDVAAELDHHPGAIAFRSALAERDGPGAAERARAEIRRLRAGRSSFTRIARHLNDLGLRDPEGQPWTRMTVFRFER